MYVGGSRSIVSRNLMCSAPPKHPPQRNTFPYPFPPPVNGPITELPILLPGGDVPPSCLIRGPEVDTLVPEAGQRRAPGGVRGSHDGLVTSPILGRRQSCTFPRKRMHWQVGTLERATLRSVACSTHRGSGMVSEGKSVHSTARESSPLEPNILDYSGLQLRAFNRMKNMNTKNRLCCLWSAITLPATPNMRSVFC